MLITVKTFNSHNINDGTSYLAALQNPHGTASAELVYLDEAETDSVDVGMYTVNVQSKVINIEIRDYANRHALITQLKTWFERGTQGDLVVTFSDEAIDYQLTCRVVNLVQDQEYPQRFRAILQTGMSKWRAVDETTEDTWELTTDDDSLDIVVGGKDETYLSLDVTAVLGPASGYLFRDIYRLPNTPGLAHGLIAWCITVDTATLVSGGKMQADCDDLRIVNMYTGKEIKRWISNPNNAATKVWIVLNLAKGFSLVLLDAVAGAGDVDYLQFTVDDTHKKKIGEMPKQGIVYHNNEWFRYIATDPTNCRLTIRKRGLYGTTIEAHSSGVTFTYIQYPLMMKYGNATVGAPSASNENYDNTKPLFNLANSGNTSWVWTASDLFYDPNYPNRVGRWKFSRQALGPRTEIFYVKQDAESGDAAMGLKAESFQLGRMWKDENVKLTALFFRAAGLTSCSMTGDKIRTNANWLELAALRRSANNKDFFNLWTEATPGSPSSWSAWTHNSVSVAAGSRYLQLILQGGYPAGDGDYAAIEALTATVDFNSSNIPTGAFLGEEDNYPLEIVIENEATGDILTLDYMMKLGETFSIDGELNVIEYDEANAFDAVSLDDEGRNALIRLQGGATNTIRITGGGGQLDIVPHYYTRRL